MPGGLHRICCCPTGNETCLALVSSITMTVQGFNPGASCGCDAITVPSCFSPHDANHLLKGEETEVTVNGTYVSEATSDSSESGKTIRRYDFGDVLRFRGIGVMTFKESTRNYPASCEVAQGAILYGTVWIIDNGAGTCGVRGVQIGSAIGKSISAFAYIDEQPTADYVAGALGNEGCGLNASTGISLCTFTIASSGSVSFAFNP